MSAKPGIRVPLPATHYEAVMWASFSAFYACLVTLVVVVLTGPPMRWLFAAIIATFGSWLGAQLAREIHQDQRAGPVGASDKDWEIGES